MIKVSHDYLDPAFISDPYPYFKRMREEMPVHWNERWRGWIVTRYDDVYAALHNDLLLADTITPYFKALTPEDQQRYALTYDVLNSWTVFLDPPKHTRYRRMMQRAFTPRAIARMREVVEQIVTRQLDTWEAKKQIDVIDDFAYPLPANVIASMIGAPAADVHLFHGWADTLTNLLHGGVGTADRLARAQTAVEEFREYLSGLYTERLSAPKADMMSWLMEAQAVDPSIREEDVIYSCMLLLVAGHETTQNLIANTLVALLSAPDQLDLLRRDERHVRTAIEEGLRFNGPAKGTMRVAAADMEIRGAPIRKDDRVLLWMAAANRDPERFNEPDKFDVTRNPNPHLTFSHGIHFCMGAPLARLELEVALTHILRRFPKLALAGPVVWRPRVLTRTMEAPLLMAVA
jgi:cytochrome P450